MEREVGTREFLKGRDRAGDTGAVHGGEGIGESEV